MKILPLSSLLFCALLGLSACTTCDYRARPSQPPGTVTVAVKQFTTPNYEAMSAIDKGVREYEHVYFQAALIQALARTPGVEKAYVAGSDTPAVDIMVDGVINGSNGRDVDFTLIAKRIDGVELASKQFVFSHSATDAVGVGAADVKLMYEAAAFVASARQRLKLNRDELRALVYAKAPGVFPTEGLTKMGREAASVECSQLLVPLTNVLLPAVTATSGMYYEWQKESIPVVAQKQVAEQEKASAEADEAIGAFLGVASAATGISAARQGNTAVVNMSQTNMLNAAGIVDTAAANAQVAENQVNQLGGVLASYKSQFNVGPGREVTVRIYNRVLTLKGSMEEMTNEFRKVVEEEMKKELARAAALQGVAKKNEKTAAS